MSKLILAQGASHIDTDKLINIINNMNNQLGINVSNYSDKYSDYIESTYDSNFDSTTPIYCNRPYIAEEKYDGFSYLNQDGKFFSKSLSSAKGNEGNAVEKTGHVPHISALLKRAFEYCGANLHGEIYVPGGISDDVTKILGCTEDKAVERIHANWDKRPRYMLIDIREFMGKSLLKEPYYIRRALLEHVYDKYIRPFDMDHNIMLAEILHGDPNEEFKRIVLSGGEGIIIKKTSALYIPDKKPADNWIKGKKKITLDVVITGFNDGTGKNKSLFGSFEFGIYIDGKLTKCGSCSSGLNDEIRNRIAKDPDSYIGTVMEIEAIQASVKSFRNAVFLRLRDDKAAIDCTPLNIKVKTSLIV